MYADRFLSQGAHRAASGSRMQLSLPGSAEGKGGAQPKSSRYAHVIEWASRLPRRAEAFE